MLFLRRLRDTDSDWDLRRSSCIRATRVHRQGERMPGEQQLSTAHFQGSDVASIAKNLFS